MTSKLSARSAKVALVLALSGAVLMGAGIATAITRLLGPMGGFALFQLGALSSILGFVASLPAWYWARGAERGIDRRRALSALGLSVAAVGGLALVLGNDLGAPVINDVTTDPDEPPRFSELAAVDANRGRDMSYPSEFAPQQEAAYPDLKPIVVDASPTDALERARATASRLNWQLVHVDRAALRLEAVDATPLFRFVDDIVIRVRPSAAGAVLDVRSKSRLGRGDLGRNADRIRTFLDAFSDTPRR